MEEDNEADMAVNLEVKVEVVEGAREGRDGGRLSRRRWEASSEQFSDEDSPVEPVEP